jgi:hypothetical protein
MKGESEDSMGTKQLLGRKRVLIAREATLEAHIKRKSSAVPGFATASRTSRRQKKP